MSITVTPIPARRWDPVVRLTHWSMAAAIVANALLVEVGSGVHVRVGYGLAAVLALRLLWGLVGPASARFGAFPPSPRRALAHIRDIAAGQRSEHRSHNPLGALMVYAIWATLAVVIGSGIAMSGLPPLPSTAAVTGERAVPTDATVSEADDDDDDGRHGAGRERKGVAEELHETAVNILYALILLHIAGVVFETRRSGRQIVMAMLPTRQ
ncbi:cytochrome b/b6 domain-containing protein [Sandarakinorhabdus sp. DWP1-3-1]|uniref:cytochrome b/b6 domain-containing protein n=1 Tax=Sandarakinorhabdus sp. DWP1-3-1 TaxID=2804627 RepID=UPI003CF0D602